MVKRKRSSDSGEDSSASDSENLLLSASSGALYDSDSSSSSSSRSKSLKNSRGGSSKQGFREGIKEVSEGQSTGLGVSGEVGHHRQLGKPGVRIPTKSCIGSSKGWLDVIEKFVRKPPNARREDYFQLYGKACQYRLGEGKYSDDTLRRFLGDLPFVNKASRFDRSYLNSVRYAFQIPKEYEIVQPEDGESIYSRRDDHWVGIPLEHFRAGLRLPMYRFIHTLFVDMRLGLGQVGPNSIRKICAFLARCEELGWEPTLSLFWSLHKLQASRGFSPLFELHWKEGKSLGGALVENPSSNKGWHLEWLLFRGGDLEYLPEYKKPDEILGGVRRVENLSPEELRLAKAFVGDKPKGMWSQKTFWDVSVLLSHKCKIC